MYEAFLVRTKARMQACNLLVTHQQAVANSQGQGQAAGRVGSTAVHHVLQHPDSLLLYELNGTICVCLNEEHAASLVRGCARVGRSRARQSLGRGCLNLRRRTAAARCAV